MGRTLLLAAVQAENKKTTTTNKTTTKTHLCIDSSGKANRTTPALKWWEGEVSASKMPGYLQVSPGNVSLCTPWVHLGCPDTLPLHLCCSDSLASFDISSHITALLPGLIFWSLCLVFLMRRAKRNPRPNPAVIFRRENQGYSVGFSGIAWGLHLVFVIRAGPLWSGEN